MKFVSAEEAVAVIKSKDRVFVHSVAEYGVANLYGKNLRQRARALIEVAHPEHRAALEREAHERFKRFGE